MDIHGRTIIITGASMGIGAATARALSGMGAHLTLAARSKEPLEELARELGTDRVLGVPTDVTDPVQVKAMVDATLQRFGGVDVLVNNAGVGLSGRVADMDVGDFEEVLATNVVGPLHAMQAVIPHMRRSGHGVIVNVSSMVTKLNIPTIGGYRASKVALNTLSDNARMELAPDGIRVVVVHPGATSSNFFRNTINAPDRGGEPAGPRTRDTPEQVAERIIDGIRSEPREVYMNGRSRAFATVTTLVPGLFGRLITRRRHS